MLAPFIPPFRKRRLKGRYTAKDAAPVPPVLTAATYDPGTSIDLSFDKAVDVSQIIPILIFLDDFDDTHARYRGTGAPTILAPNRFVLALEHIGPPQGDLIRLTAGPHVGIYAVDDGAEWEGVTGLPIPYP